MARGLTYHVGVGSSYLSSRLRVVLLLFYALPTRGGVPGVSKLESYRCRLLLWTGFQVLQVVRAAGAAKHMLGKRYNGNGGRIDLILNCSANGANEAEDAAGGMATLTGGISAVAIRAAKTHAHPQQFSEDKSYHCLER